MTVPGVIIFLQKVLYNLIFMDILHTESWLFHLFYQDDVDLVDTESLNSFFEENGFQSKQVLKNLGSTVLFLFLFFALWLIIGLVHAIRQKT